MYFDNLEVKIHFKRAKNEQYIEREPDPTDGYLGQMKEGSFLIHAEVFSLNLFYCLRKAQTPFLSDDLTLVKSKKPNPDGTESVYFTSKAPLFGWSEGKKPHTRDQQNKLVLVELDNMEMGAFRVWKFAIASYRGSQFFIHNTEEGRFYRDAAGKAVCPKFDEKWLELIELLEPLMLPDALAPVTDYAAEPEITADDLPAGQGRVLFYNPDKCWGALATPEGVVRVHVSSIITKERFARLQKGELVKYEKLVPAASEQTTRRLTTFQHEAKKVRKMTEEEAGCVND